MKKLFLSLVVLLCGMGIISAQDFAKFRFGVTGGMNISNTTSEVADSKIGFQVGLRGEYNFNNSLYLNAAILWDQKGWKVEDESANNGYINLPIHIGYRYNFSEKFSIFAEVGPYFAYGVTGDIFDIDGINRFDCGIGGRAGIEICKFQVHAGYDYGLTDLADIEDAAKNTNIMVGVSYMF